MSQMLCTVWRGTAKTISATKDWKNIIKVLLFPRALCPPSSQIWPKRAVRSAQCTKITERNTNRKEETSLILNSWWGSWEFKHNYSQASKFVWQVQISDEAPFSSSLWFLVILRVQSPVDPGWKFLEEKYEPIHPPSYLTLFKFLLNREINTNINKEYKNRDKRFLNYHILEGKTLHSSKWFQFDFPQNIVHCHIIILFEHIAALIRVRKFSHWKCETILPLIQPRDSFYSDKMWTNKKERNTGFTLDINKCSLTTSLIPTSS